MTLPNIELEARRDLLCSQLGLVKDALSFFRVPEKYKDDLIQEIFIVAYKNIDKINDISKLNSWLYKISYRKMLSFMQKQRALNEREVLYSPEEWEREEFRESEAILVWDIIDGYFDDSDISELVEKLKHPAPEIIRLRFVDGFMLKEISEMLNLNYNTVKTIEYRAFKQLKQMIENQASHSDDNIEA